MSDTTTAEELGWADEARTVLRPSDSRSSTPVVKVRRLVLAGLVSDVASRDTLIDELVAVLRSVRQRASQYTDGMGGDDLDFFDSVLGSLLRRVEEVRGED